MKDTSTISLNNFNYNDRYFRLIIALPVAHFLTVYGYDANVFELMLKLNYWIALLFSYLIALAGLFLVYTVTSIMDRKYDWWDYPLQRTALQLLAGWVLPGVCVFLLAACYFGLFGFNILESDYMKLDFPLIVLLLLLANVYYLCFNFYLRNKQLEAGLSGFNKIDTQKLTNRENAKVLFIVKGPLHNIPVKTKSCAYFYILNGSVFLRTFEINSMQDAYPIPETLKEIESILDSNQFFRISRKTIVNFDAIASFLPGKNQTLQLVLTPPMNGNPDNFEEVSKLAIVSEDRVPAFKKWIER
jgi:DNA-binding LytR/AlgR family response regulator